MARAVQRLRGRRLVGVGAEGGVRKEDFAEYVNALNFSRGRVAQGTLVGWQLIEEAYKMEYALVTKAGVYVSPLFCLSVRYVVGLDSSVPQPGYFINECCANR